MQKFKISSIHELDECASAFASLLKPGTTVLLEGQLGSGKSEFVRHVAAHLGVSEEVMSPTFCFVNDYCADNFNVYHFDLYRLDSEDELSEIGFDEHGYNPIDGVSFIEWSNLYSDSMPEEAIKLTFEGQGDEPRDIAVEAYGKTSCEMVAKWLANNNRKFVLAFDTSNEKVILGLAEIGLIVANNEDNPSSVCVEETQTNNSHCNSNQEPSSGVLDAIKEKDKDPECLSESSAPKVLIKSIFQKSFDSKRASNQKLLPEIDILLKENHVDKSEIVAIGVGRGPGSFTGVRIALASAKGICSALNVPLYGISTLDAVAENLRLSGKFGDTLVVADAMRGEVYPVEYDVKNNTINRKNADTVAKPQAFVDSHNVLQVMAVCGDGLIKHKHYFEEKYHLLDECFWYPTGQSLVSLLVQQMNEALDWQSSLIHNASKVLPVYTRLSDAEENELSHILQNKTKDLVTGVQGDDTQISISPVKLDDCKILAEFEKSNFGSDAWSENSFKTDVCDSNRVWLKGVINSTIVGYVGASRSSSDADVLKICVDPKFRKQGIARRLLSAAFETLRNLGASNVMLEVRFSNSPARALYESLGFSEVCTRKNFYGNEDAVSYSLDISNFSANEEFVEADSLLKPNARKPLIFAIESSCDETAGAIVDGEDSIISNVVSSSAKFHARFGGVVPEIASRKHIEVISQVAEETLRLAGMKNYDSIDAVAVTAKPGLVGSLVVGLAFAKGVAWGANKPLILVDHLVGHLFANKLCSDSIKMPCVASLISGGNTMLVLVRDWGDYEVIGGTIDDAVGEAFDKVARAMNLPYPGGPEISALAKEGNADNVELPRPLLHSHDLRMSLSGLKTAVILEIERLKKENADGCLTRQNMCDICASFEQSICDVQVAKAHDALVNTHAKTFCFGGGVAANRQLRGAYSEMCDNLGVSFCVAPTDVCGDNAAMIGLAAQFEFKNKRFASLDADVSSSSRLNSRR